MRNILKTGLVCLSMIMLGACDNGFEEMNRDPNKYSDVIPEYLFTGAQLDGLSTNFVGAAYLTIGGSMQHFATYKEVPAAGDKYFNYGYSTGNWGSYTTSINKTLQVINALEKAPNSTNKLAIARIWKAYIFHRLTDLYGDIPYSEAGKALMDKNYSPKYDTQEFIYNDLLKELETSIQSFDSNQPSFGSSDLLYDGNLEQWKKFGYSLMLRLGMRLTEVAPALAETWVKKAIAGGVITENQDIATVEYVDGSQTTSRNFITGGLLTIDYITPGGDNVEGGKFAKTFIDHLKNTKDPRLNVFSIVWINTGNGFVADTSTALQEGMPNGAFNSLPPDFNKYSEPNPATLLKYGNPVIVMGNAEMHLLIAEAVVRGWYSGTTAEAAYEKAVTAGMKQWALFGGGGVIADERIAYYLQQNPFPANGSLQEQYNAIHTQKWVSLFLQDEYEIFSNWRRTGMPALTPTNYPGNLTGGKIPTRFVIPDSEEIYNTENFYEARARQGGTNLLSSVVWWDK